MQLLLQVQQLPHQLLYLLLLLLLLLLPLHLLHLHGARQLPLPFLLLLWLAGRMVCCMQASALGNPQKALLLMCRHPRVL